MASDMPPMSEREEGSEDYVACRLTLRITRSVCSALRAMQLISPSGAGGSDDWCRIVSQLGQAISIINYAPGLASGRE